MNPSAFSSSTISPPRMRMLIAAMLQRDPEIEVVGEAADPLEARQAIKALNPDVITLDIEMPNMNGLEFLEKIMRLRPMPVVMVSTLTQPAPRRRCGRWSSAPSTASPSLHGRRRHAFDDLAAKVKAAGLRPGARRCAPGRAATRRGAPAIYHARRPSWSPSAPPPAASRR